MNMGRTQLLSVFHSEGGVNAYMGQFLQGNFTVSFLQTKTQSMYFKSKT